VLWPI